MTEQRVSNSKFDRVFTIKDKNKESKLTVLDHPILTLRPITRLEDGTLLILFYLPTKKEKSGGAGIV